MRVIGVGSTFVALVLGLGGCGRKETSATKAAAAQAPSAPKLVTPEGLTFDSDGTLTSPTVRASESSAWRSPVD